MRVTFAPFRTKCWKTVVSDFQCPAAVHQTVRRLETSVRFNVRAMNVCNTLEETKGPKLKQQRRSPEKLSNETATFFNKENCFLVKVL